jgi:hypothetical protein
LQDAAPHFAQVVAKSYSLGSPPFFAIFFEFRVTPYTAGCLLPIAKFPQNPARRMQYPSRGRGGKRWPALVSPVKPRTRSEQYCSERVLFLSLKGR